MTRRQFFVHVVAATAICCVLLLVLRPFAKTPWAGWALVVLGLVYHGYSLACLTLVLFFNPDR